jgi:hypothetical protein
MNPNTKGARKDTPAHVQMPSKYFMCFSKYLGCKSAMTDRVFVMADAKKTSICVQIKEGTYKYRSRLEKTAGNGKKKRPITFPNMQK